MTQERNHKRRETKSGNHQSFLCTNLAPCTISDSSTSYHDWSPTVVRDAYAVRDLHFLCLALGRCFCRSNSQNLQIPVDSECAPNFDCSLHLKCAVNLELAEDLHLVLT